MIAKVSIPNASVIDLENTIYNVIASPGAGKAVVIQQCLIESNFANVYSNVNGSAKLAVVYGNLGAFASQQVDATTLLTNTANIIAVFQFAMSGTLAVANPQFQKSDIENLALNVWLDNGGDGALAGGDIANELVITILYNIVDV